MKALVGVDGSAAGYEAVREIGRLISPEHDQVAFYFVPPHVHLRGEHRLPPLLVERTRASLVDGVFREADGCLPAAWRGRAARLVGTLDPRAGLLLAAEETRADLLVVGARGRSRVQRLVLGSVSTSLAHESPVPVLIARGQLNGPDDKPPRVLLAYDGSQTARHAGALLSRFTWPADTAGHVVTVVESIFGGEPSDWIWQAAQGTEEEALAQQWLQRHVAEVAAGRREAAALASRLPGPFQGREPIVAQGDAAEKVLDAIATEQIDLVVLGARRLAGMSRLLLGSTSQKVLAHAPCSVLLVRQPPGA